MANPSHEQTKTPKIFGSDSILRRKPACISACVGRFTARIAHRHEFRNVTSRVSRLYSMIHKLVHGDRSSVRRVEEEWMEEDRYDDKSMKRSKTRRKSIFLFFLFFWPFSSILFHFLNGKGKRNSLFFETRIERNRWEVF